MTTFVKLDDDLRLVVGIAMTAGEVDSQGDVVNERELTKAAMNALGAGVKIDHRGESVGRVVQSLALTRDVAKALGIAVPDNKAGVWIVGLQVDDPATWARVKAGEVSGGLSVGGQAKRRAA